MQFFLGSGSTHFSFNAGGFQPSGTNEFMRLTPGTSLELANNESLSFSSTSTSAGSQDTGLSRQSPGVLSVDTTGHANGLGTIQAAAFSPIGTQQTVNCSTSGTVIFSEPFQGASDKKVLIHMAACIGTASYTFPAAFTNIPSVYASNNVAASIATSVSITAVTVTGATTTGSLVLEDF
jgi:hypothetical protein